MDFILLDGDTVKFDPAFGDATVVVKDGSLVASGFGIGDGAKLCVNGDEGRVSVPGCSYTTKTHPLAGTGTLSIKALAGDQIASRTTCEGEPVLLVGGKFEALFTPMVPAKQQLPNGALVPGPTAPLAGTGSFVTSNDWLRGT